MRVTCVLNMFNCVSLHAHVLIQLIDIHERNIELILKVL